MRPFPAANNMLRAQEMEQRKVCAKTDYEILINIWQDVEYRFAVAKGTRGTHSELIND
jgi:hypothetical protein